MNVRRVIIFRRVLLLFAVAFPLPSAIPAEEIQTNINNFGISFELNRSWYPPGTTVIASTAISNGTPQDLRIGRIPDTSPARDGCVGTIGTFEVHRVSSATNLNCRWTWSGVGDSHSGEHQPPGEISWWSTDLTDQFGLTESGVYQVRLLARLPPGASSGKLFPTPELTIVISNRPLSDTWNPAERIEETGPKSDGLQLRALLPKHEFRKGEAIPLVVLLNNLTETNKVINEPKEKDAFELTLKAEDGHPVSYAGMKLLREQELARRKANPDVTFWPLEAVIPGHGRRWYDFRLDQQFDIETSGTYTLEVRPISPEFLPDSMSEKLVFRVR